MAPDADIVHSPDTTLGLTPSGRIFKSFRRWPAVPVSDLLRLRHAFVLTIETDRSAAAQELLRPVDGELTRRTASSGGIIPLVPRPGDDPRPEAG
jgi:hypothetical protein